MLLRTFLIKITTQADSAGTDKAGASVDALGSKAKGAAKETKTLGAEAGRASKQAGAVATSSAKAATGLVRMRDGAARAGKALAGAAQAAGKAAGALVAAGTAVAGVALAKTISFVGDETARLDGIAKSAQKSGLGFDAYQRLAHVATLSGTNIEALGKATLKLGLNLDDVASGGGKAAGEALDKLGITVEQLRGKTATEQLGLISDAMLRIPDDAERSRIAFDLLGKSGTELIPLFNSGSEAIGKMSESVGKVFTREELAAAEAYQDALANLKAELKSLAGSAAASLAPVLTDLADSTRKWVSENRGIVDSAIPRIKSAFETLVRALKRIDLLGILEGFSKAVGFVVENFDLLIGLLAAAKTASAFGAVASGFTSMGLAAGAALGPIGLIAAAVAALIPVALRAGDALGDVISKQHAVATAPRGGGTDLAAGGEFAPELQRKAGKQSEELLAAEAQTRRLVAEGVGGYRLSAARQREAEARSRLRDTQTAIEERVASGRAEQAKAEQAVAQAKQQAEAEAKAEQDEFGAFDAGVAELRQTLGLKEGEEASGAKQRKLDKAIAILAGGGKLENAKKLVEQRRGGGGARKPKPAEAGAAAQSDFLTSLGLVGPGSMLENRPAPQTLTIYISPTIKLVDSMTINIAAGTPDEQAKQYRDAADQAADAMTSRLSDVAKVVEDMFALRARALAAARGGGATLPGVP